MERLLTLVGGSGIDNRVGGADSNCDRLSCTYTVYLLMLFAVLVTGKLFVGEPIACFCPDHFTESQVQFTNNVCWTTSTYYLPYEKEIPTEDERHRYISYYQWIPLILITQAVMFHLPRAAWNVLNKKSGIAIATITDAAIECQKQTNTEEKEKIMCYITKHMGTFLVERHKKSQTVKRKSICMAFYGYYLYGAYLVIKLLYIGNVIGQLFLLNFFLGGGYEWFGWDAIMKLTRGEGWGGSDRFPRVTLCDFKTRVIGNVHRYTVLCSLPMNLVHELVFIFLWFWFVFVAGATIVSLLTWLGWAMREGRNRKYIFTRLTEISDEEDVAMTKKDLNIFADIFLKRDGKFILKIVAQNTSKILTAELIFRLWKYYQQNQKVFSQEENSESEVRLRHDDQELD